MLTEILPNITGPILVEATVRVGYAVFAAASLSFIGLGVPPPSSNWGAMINETHLYITVDPWIVLAPTLAIASLVVAHQLAGRWPASGGTRMSSQSSTLSDAPSAARTRGRCSPSRG